MSHPGQACALGTLACALSLLACSSQGAPTHAADAAHATDAARASDAGADSDDLATRTAAVERTLASNAACALPAFYWEIGDVRGVLASGTVGSGVGRATVMDIASASKLVFGAYVVERFRDDPSAIDLRAMRMLSGYTSLVYARCLLSKTVQACLDASDNGTHTAENDDFFFYNGGHFQKYAVDLGLGSDDAAALAAEIARVLGGELGMTYSSPQLAAGLRTSAADYARFLQRILAGELTVAGKLGADPVCTLPASCPTAKSSPAPYAWHYSYGHWVEDEPGTGDGAFSSPGAFGFYPWIDATKTHYGILARHVVGDAAYIESARCGRLLRKAFATGNAQPNAEL